MILRSFIELYWPLVIYWRWKKRQRSEWLRGVPRWYVQELADMPDQLMPEQLRPILAQARREIAR